jgi:hypothetical protein
MDEREKSKVIADYGLTDELLESVQCEPGVLGCYMLPVVSTLRRNLGILKILENWI